MERVEDQVEYLKQRFQRAFVPNTLYTEPGPTVEGCQKEASILILLHWKDNDWHVFLTLRSAHLRAHAGEVSFPGGKREEQDESFVETALREANEEAGIPYDSVIIVGAISHLITRMGIQVRPILAVLREEFEPEINEEVERAFWMPLSVFLSKEHHEDLYFPEAKLKSHKVEYNGEYIFGFTSYVAILIAMNVYNRFPEFEISNMNTSESPEECLCKELMVYNTMPQLVKQEEYDSMTKSKL
ncbi:unnamed protein product [Bursaphelenchus xylophilus]|uniref:(pine wood nematode) hypothetical protein n=1 Tax=Bursaphelenchus xylophilus TaxID=6326 RepID=A0A1I7S7W3_BURXY|nr:unnamed protein product [Bursaphelenchus xylophilus]CAG9087135.1 unnamed protein product [Bursaphelenchus xylophilus]